jgi:hypothetical protein
VSYGKKISIVTSVAVLKKTDGGEGGEGVGASRARQIIPKRYFILLPLAMAYICMRFIYT